jgi:PIN domain nuclease of toxin-antitoxin system
MASAVVDSSAILVWLQNERGADRLAECFPGALVSAVNLAEVQTKLVATGDDTLAAWRKIQFLGLESVPFDDDQAQEAGNLAKLTKKFGLSLGDRACLVLAARRNLKAMTADRPWKNLPLSIEIEVIR